MIVGCKLSITVKNKNKYSLYLSSLILLYFTENFSLRSIRSKEKEGYLVDTLASRDIRNHVSWRKSEREISFKGNSFIMYPLGFSFSCSAFYLLSRNSDD